MRRNLPFDVWKRIDKAGPDECWLWRGLRDPGGYGVMSIASRFYRVHRIVYATVNPGEIEMAAPKNRHGSGFLLHKCDVRNCCNPAHLYIGTQKQNSADRNAHGRSADVRGANAPSAKLSNTDVLFIRHWLDTGHSQGKIAQAFGVRQTTISMIKCGHTWGSL